MSLDVVRPNKPIDKNTSIWYNIVKRSGSESGQVQCTHRVAVALERKDCVKRWQSRNPAPLAANIEKRAERFTVSNNRIYTGRSTSKKKY